MQRGVKEGDYYYISLNLTIQMLLLIIIKTVYSRNFPKQNKLTNKQTENTVFRDPDKRESCTFALGISFGVVEY